MSDILQVDEDQRWLEIQNLSAEIAYRDDPPSVIESALCGAVYRARAWHRELTRLRAEVERLRQWVHDLQSGMYVNCVYCGHRYGPQETTPVTMADALKEHIAQCPQHPMSALKAEIDRLREDAERYRWLRQYCDLHWELSMQKTSEQMQVFDDAIDAARKEGE